MQPLYVQVTSPDKCRVNHKIIGGNTMKIFKNMFKSNKGGEEVRKLNSEIDEIKKEREEIIKQFEKQIEELNKIMNK